MKRITLIILIQLFTIIASAQISTTPSPAIADSSVTINFNKAGTPLANYNGTLYAHIGLTVDGNQWQNVIGDWGNNNNQPTFTLVSGSNYQLTLSPDLYTYFNVPNTSTITQICIVIRAASGAPQTQDFFLNVGSFQLTLNTPTQNSTSIINSGESFTINASNTGGNANYELKSNGITINSQNGISQYSFIHQNITSNQSYELIASQNNLSITKRFNVIANPGTISESMPNGLEDGINYDDTNQGAYLVLNAPYKDFVYVAGSFNNWQPNTNYAMKKDPTTGKFWIHISGLTPGEIYTYQYWVGDVTNLPAGSPAIVKTADPFSTLVLSPFDDPWISQTNYPDLPAYPEGQEREVTVLQTAKPAYNWQVTNFEKPSKENLVIYEVLVRDFDANRSYQDLINKIDYFKNLKINAIQLMPVMEFEGNESWGYNTSFHMALDKFYGTENKLKEFIDICHQNGIAVILDLALNHAFGRNPMVRMWMNDPDNDGWGDTTSENPYFNTQAMHSYNVGYDFNHQSELTQYYTQRVVRYWIEEFKIDGIRWDLTKGFTQNCPYNGNAAAQDNCTNSYQADRVAILKQYADFSWELDPDHYVIFEHLGTDQEEQQWANYRANENKGIMLWGKMTDQYNQLTMGYASNSNITRMGHTSRGFNKARLVGYAESHDEERLMYKNLQFGNNSNTNHNVKNENIALSRMSALGAVSLLVPGPKMIWHFGDLGYDLSINTCENGTVSNDCKLATKPQPQWTEYGGWLQYEQRRKIYNDWSRMINLKINNPVFAGEYEITSNNLTPRIFISDSSLEASELKDIIVLANFDVNAQNINPNFPYTGTWINLMTDETVQVNQTNMSITLQPGEYRIFGNQSATLNTEDFIEVKDLELYPNPAQTFFALNQDVRYLEVYSYSGQLVKKLDGRMAFNLFNIEDLSSGIYLIKATNHYNEIKTIRLVKN